MGTLRFFPKYLKGIDLKKPMRIPVLSAVASCRPGELSQCSARAETGASHRTQWADGSPSGVAAKGRGRAFLKNMRP